MERYYYESGQIEADGVVETYCEVCGTYGDQYVQISGPGWLVKDRKAMAGEYVAFCPQLSEAESIADFLNGERN